jgi:hypothetical protein
MWKEAVVLRYRTSICLEGMTKSWETSQESLESNSEPSEGGGGSQSLNRGIRWPDITVQHKYNRQTVSQLLYTLLHAILFYTSAMNSFILRTFLLAQCFLYKDHWHRSSIYKHTDTKRVYLWQPRTSLETLNCRNKLRSRCTCQAICHLAKFMETWKVYPFAYATTSRRMRGVKAIRR